MRMRSWLATFFLAYTLAVSWLMLQYSSREVEAPSGAGLIVSDASLVISQQASILNLPEVAVRETPAAPSRHVHSLGVEMAPVSESAEAVAAEPVPPTPLERWPAPRPAVVPEAEAPPMAPIIDVDPATLPPESESLSNRFMRALQQLRPHEAAPRPPH